jgi:CheY-like chemotaxis protein
MPLRPWYAGCSDGEDVAAAAPSEGRLEPGRGPARILIVDDDQDVRDALRESLELMGHLVSEAANGRQALDVMTSTPDLCLVLLDLRMPIMSGWEFLEAKSRMPAFAELPVVVVSATEPTPAVLAQTAGFLKKPADLDALLAYVDRFCG